MPESLSVCPRVIFNIRTSLQSLLGCLPAPLSRQGGLTLLFPLSLRDGSSLEEFSLLLFHNNSHIIFSCFIYIGFIKDFVWKHPARKTGG